jgi:hypothetical protein
MNVFGEAAVIIRPKQKNNPKYEYFLTDLRVVLLVTSSRMLSSTPRLRICGSTAANQSCSEETANNHVIGREPMG